MIICRFEDGLEVSLRHVTVDSIVLKDGKILLVKRAAKLAEGGKWALPGGYMDRDETIAQAAAREILEETGWQVTSQTLFRIIDTPSRPNEDKQNISMVFICEASEKTGEPDWESDEVRWFALDALPPETEIAFDHASNISKYLQHLKADYPLPLLA